MIAGSTLHYCLPPCKQNQIKTDISKPKKAFIALFFHHTFWCLESFFQTILGPLVYQTRLRSEYQAILVGSQCRPSWWNNDSAVCLALRILLQGKSWKEVFPVPTICWIWQSGGCWAVYGSKWQLIIKPVWNSVTLKISHWDNFSSLTMVQEAHRTWPHWRTVIDATSLPWLWYQQVPELGQLEDFCWGYFSSLTMAQEITNTWLLWRSIVEAITLPWLWYKPLNLALTQKNRELSTRNTSFLAVLLLQNLIESFFNIAAFLSHIRDD